MKTTRQSNIELLRIVAMLMVLGLHAYFNSLGYPSPKRVEGDPFGWLGMIFCEQSCLSCVDTFVLITGWFGTHFKLRNFVRLLFQTFFVAAVVTACLWIVLGKMPGTAHDIFRAEFTYWFVFSYILLYLFTPALNAFTEQTDERGLRNFLLLYFVFCIPFSFCLNDLSRGFSAVWFMGLYLLGRYVRLYLAPLLANVGKWHFFWIWLALVVGMTAAYWAHIYFRNPILPNLPSFMTAYTNPLTVVCAVSMLLFFDRLRLSNAFINWLAAGSFTVYLVHQQAFVRPYFFKYFRWLNAETGGIAFFFAAAGSVLLIYLLSACFDQVRLLAWRGVSKFYERVLRNRE